MKYRKDIQGLRGIAVLFVLFYHLYPNKIAGGFIGVDIFFVISGFLVFYSIEKKIIEENEPIFFSFYAARLRRLLPSSIIVIYITSFYIYKYDSCHFSSFRRDAVSCLFVYANYHFYYNKIDYFHSGLKDSPLLHYWSLSLEEQFYITIPVLLWFSSHYISIVYFIIFLLSFCICIHYGYDDRSKGYFFLSSRSWEFVLAALVRHIPIIYKTININYISYISVILLVFLSLQYNDSILYPSYNAMLPVLLSLTILNSSHLNNLLINKLTLVIGNLSYSIYLFHYPLIKTMIKITIFYYFILTIGVIVLYYVVEYPFYKGSFIMSNNKTYIFSIISIVILNELIFKFNKKTNKMLKLMIHYSSKILIDDHKKLYKNFCYLSSYYSIQNSSILFVGDSHISQYIIAFISNRGKIDITIIYYYIFRRNYIKGLNIFPLLKYSFNICLLGNYIENDKIFDSINNNNTISKFYMCRTLLLSNDNPHHNVDPNSCMDKNRYNCYGTINESCFIPKNYSIPSVRNAKVVTLWDSNILKGKICKYYSNNLPIYADYNHLSLFYINSISIRIISLFLQFFTSNKSQIYNRTCKYYRMK